MQKKKKPPPSNKKKKTTTKKKKKKKDKSPLLSSKLKDAENNTVITHGNYCFYQPYAYQVQYYDKPQPEYIPSDLTVKFLPKFKLPYCVVPSIIAICNLSLPNSLIDGIVQ